MDSIKVIFFLAAGLLGCLSGVLAVPTADDVDDIRDAVEEVQSKNDDIVVSDYPAAIETAVDAMTDLTEVLEGATDITMDELTTAINNTPFVVSREWYDDLCKLIDAITKIINIITDDLLPDTPVGTESNNLQFLRGALEALRNLLQALKDIIDDDMIIEGDPHFLMFLGNSRQPVCFDFHGRDNDVIQLLRDDLLDVTVNGQLFETDKSTPDHLRSYFSNIAVMVDDCTLVARTEGVYINEEKFSWDDEGRYQRCNGLMKFAFVDGQLLVDTGKGISLTLLKHNRLRIGDFLGIYFSDHSGLSTHSHGIIGQMYFKRLLVQGDLDVPSSEGYMVFPTVEHKLPQKVVASMYRFNKRTKERPKCWKVEDEGKGLLDGQKEDYFQKDHNLFYRGLLPALKPYLM